MSSPKRERELAACSCRARQQQGENHGKESLCILGTDRVEFRLSAINQSQSIRTSLPALHPAWDPLAPVREMLSALPPVQRPCGLVTISRSAAACRRLTTQSGPRRLSTLAHQGRIFRGGAAMPGPSYGTRMERVLEIDWTPCPRVELDSSRATKAEERKVPVAGGGLERLHLRAPGMAVPNLGRPTTAFADHISRCKKLRYRDRVVLVERVEGAEFVRYHDPVFSIDAQGSADGKGSPCWSSSTDSPSGVFTKAMRPSRGGRLIVMPASIIF